ncbi:MAG: DUF2520 domain-containing protein [Chloroflexi bacterium]|nr:DUF2520 domain-containing protein [Chloroflexota bacterium]
MALNRESKIGFIGSGTVGGSLAVALSLKGYKVVGAASRTFASAQSLAKRIPGCKAYESAQAVADRCDFAFITTSDDAIGPVVSSLAWREGQGVAHCSGAASLDVLGHAVEQGAIAGAFHPLQAFSSVENGVKSIPGITFGIEGDGGMRDFLKDMALSLGANPIFVRSEDKALYHLSGVMIGNLLTEYIAIAAQLWEHLGMTRADGVRALVPMARQVTVNLETSGVPAAVAGPYVRGDIGTIRKHLDALKSRAPEILPLYCELALAGFRYAEEKGTLTPETRSEIRRLLEQYRKEAAG